MIDIAIRWYGLEDWPGESDRVTGLLDRLIEAGFGRDDDGLCIECGKYPKDLPSERCAGCDAYKDHF
jgi:hypothetical protein